MHCLKPKKSPGNKLLILNGLIIKVTVRSCNSVILRVFKYIFVCHNSSQIYTAHHRHHFHRSWSNCLQHQLKRKAMTKFTVIALLFSWLCKQVRSWNSVILKGFKFSFVCHNSSKLYLALHCHHFDRSWSNCL